MTDEIQRTIPSNGGTLTPFTHANARIAAQKSAEVRRRKATLAAQNRTVARLAASDPSIITVYDAWGEIVADQADALRQSASEGKPRADDMREVGRALGMLAQPHEQAQEQASGVTVSIGAEVARELLARLGANRMVIDADET